MNDPLICENCGALNGEIVGDSIICPVCKEAMEKYGLDREAEDEALSDNH